MRQKQARILLLLITTMFCVLSWSFNAVAFYSRGNIDSNLSYESIMIETKNKTKYLVGTIVNNTNNIYDGIYVEIYGLDFFDKILWKETIYINVIDKKGKYPFEEILFSKEKEPSKLTFKVTY